MEIEDIERAVSISTKIAILVIGFVVLMYLIWFFLINDGSLSAETGVWGEFGDYFGGILNPLVALLAFYWLTQSVLIQKQELNDTKKILKETSSSQAEQVITQEKKRFEDTFFSLLDQHNKVVIDIVSEKSDGTRFIASVVSQVGSGVFGSNVMNIERAREVLHGAYNPKIGHYFRILYQLLKLIYMNSPSSDIKKEFTEKGLKCKDSINEEKLYSNIVRSFLNFELTELLAVNCSCISPEDPYYLYRLLIERYAFLEHMPLEKRNIQEVLKVYDQSAFGKSAFLLK